MGGGDWRLDGRTLRHQLPASEATLVGDIVFRYIRCQLNDVSLIPAGITLTLRTVATTGASPSSHQYSVYPIRPCRKQPSPKSSSTPS
eukprot:scaffold165675_cov27-Prasinocladus_malaysianus.AAC.1